MAAPDLFCATNLSKSACELSFNKVARGLPTSSADCQPNILVQAPSVEATLPTRSMVSTATALKLTKAVVPVLNRPLRGFAGAFGFGGPEVPAPTEIWAAPPGDDACATGGGVGTGGGDSAGVVDFCGACFFFPRPNPLNENFIRLNNLPLSATFSLTFESSARFSSGVFSCLFSAAVACGCFVSGKDCKSAATSATIESTAPSFSNTFVAPALAPRRLQIASMAELATT